MSRISDALSRAREAADGPEPESDEPSPRWMRPTREEPREAAAPWGFSTDDAAPPVKPVEALATAPTTQAARVLPRESRPSISEARSDEPLAIFRGVNPAIEDRVVVSSDLPAHCIEQYRRLAATLHQAQIDRGIRVVMITSALAGEGKSLTSTNLALTLSQSYRRRVLLIDGDLRRPSLHDIFQVANASGLFEGLRESGQATFSTLELSETLALLPAGRPDPDPMASLTSDRMRHVVDEAKSKFDWVIIDTPPVALLPDAGLLTGMADAVLLVVSAGGASCEIVKQAAERIGRKKILGVVLNRARNSVLPAEYRYDDYRKPR